MTYNIKSGLKRPVQLTLLLFMLAVSGSNVFAQSKSKSSRIAELEEMVKRLNTEVVKLRKTQSETQKHQQDVADTMKQLLVESQKQQESLLNFGKRLKKFRFGGYGEMHANFTDGKGADKFDIHRLVLYAGYDFSDWVKLHSEIEVEHAYVNKNAGGEVVIEQLFVDLNIDPKLNVRIGRVLTPLGIINANHEPTTFNGVERPSFAKYIIPSTWSSDGAGIYGKLAPWLSYELYVVGGLDGSKFSAKDGIRGGRIKERPGLDDVAITGRMDFYPFAGREMLYNQQLRIGVSVYYGGISNKNKGGDNGIGGNIKIVSGDFEYKIDRFDFRGAIAYERISSARQIGNGVAEGIFGWYLEAACHILPDSMKKGKLKDSDLIAFARYDYIDTQHDMPNGIQRNRAAQRTEWTLGVSFFPVKNIVLKADYQIRSDRSDTKPSNYLNVGIGWTF